VEGDLGKLLVGKNTIDCEPCDNNRRRGQFITASVHGKQTHMSSSGLMSDTPWIIPADAGRL
jgi:hypothetical protein